MRVFCRAAATWVSSIEAMKILMIILFRHMGEEKHPIKLAAVQDLASFKYLVLIH
jgi:hypothetical protein